LAQPAEHTKLRKVDVRIDESRQQEPIAAVVAWRAGIGFANGVIVAAGCHFAVTNQQRPILDAFERVRIAKRIEWGVKDRRPEPLPAGGVHIGTAPAASSVYRG